jgi:hypothetical protein
VGETPATVAAEDLDTGALATAPAVEVAADAFDDVGDTAPDLPLIPLGPPSTEPARRGRKPGRKRLTDRERKDRRNAKLREKAARERAQRAAEAALGMKSPPREKAAGSDTPTAAEGPSGLLGTAQPAEAAGATQAAPDPQIDSEQLNVMIGLLAHGACKMLPPKWGGGDLTAEERELLGGVWGSVLAPYLTGPASLIGLAIVSTVQVLASRAIEHQAAQPSEDPAAAVPDIPRPSSTGTPPPAAEGATSTTTKAASRATVIPPKREVKLRAHDPV